MNMIRHNNRMIYKYIREFHRDGLYIFCHNSPIGEIVSLGSRFTTVIRDRIGSLLFTQTVTKYMPFFP